MGATLDQLNTGNGSFCYVVQIEGYDRILTTGNPAAVLAAWQSSGYDGQSEIVGALSGLDVDTQQDQEQDPWAPFASPPPMITFRVAQGLDDTGALSDAFGVAVGKRSGGVETTLTTQMSPETISAFVRSSAAFDSTGTIHIGTEAIGYDTNMGDEFTDLTRGKWSPFSTESGARFARYHYTRDTSLTTADPVSVDLPPVVSDERREWVGRWVGVWLARVVGGAVDEPSDAHLVFAGRIASVSEGEHGETIVECEHALRTIYETRLMSDPFQASLAEGVTLSAAAPNQFGCVTFSNVGTPTTDTADPLTVVVGTPSSANEIQEGRYTAAELGQAINAWLQAEYAAGRTTFAVGYDATYDTGEGIRGVLSFSDPVSTSGQRLATLAFPTQKVGRWLGWSGSSATATSPTATGYQRSPSAPLRVDLWDGSGEWALTNPRGTWIDQSSILPAPLRDPNGLAQGVLRIGDRGHAVVRRTSDTLFSNAFDSTELNRYLDRLPFDPAAQITYDDANEIAVSQVIVAEGAFGDLLLRLLLSTGAFTHSGIKHNHSNYDSLPDTFGCGIPYSLLGTDFEGDVTQLAGATDPVSIIVEKPTRFSDLLNVDFILRWSYMTWGGGRIRLNAWGTPTAGNAVVTIGEDDKAVPLRSAQVDQQRSTSREPIEMVRNVVTVRYGRDASGDLLHDASFPDRDSMSVHGPRGITLEARNTLGTSSIGDLRGTLSRFAATMPLFSRPGRIIRRTMPPRLFEQLPIGTFVALTDRGVRNPETGQRYNPATGSGGLQGWPGVVIANSHTWGGPRLGLGGAPSSDDALGEVAILVYPRISSAAYSPAAEVDSTAGSSGFSAGYNSSTSTLRCQAHAYSESWNAVDASHFAAGDKIRIVEIDPNSATSPTTWTRTISSVSGSDVVLTAALSSPAWDAAKRYRIVPDTYGNVVTTQRSTVYEAGTDGLVGGARQPWALVASGRGQNSGGPLTVSAATELPARYASNSHGDGVPLDVGTAIDAAKLVNNAISYKTATQAATINGETMNGSGTWELVEMRPCFVGIGTLSGNQTIKLYVAPVYRSKTGASISVRVTLARYRPQGPDRSDVTRVDPYVSATFTTTSTTRTTGAVTGLDTRHVDRAAGGEGGWAWLYVEAGADAEYFGLAQVRVGPVEAP